MAFGTRVQLPPATYLAKCRARYSISRSLTMSMRASGTKVGPSHERNTTAANTVSP